MSVMEYTADGVHGAMPVNFGKGRVAELFGGPYRNKPDYLDGVKMAAEIDKECLIDIPTDDFCVPDVAVFRAGLKAGLLHMHKGHDLYVGCMGGIGRTGLYMAGVAKVTEKSDAILFVRHHYKPHAVETQQQMDYINDLKVWDLKLMVWACNKFPSLIKYF